jgi:hypothetical protein
MLPDLDEAGLSDVVLWLEACCTFREDFGSQLWALHNSYIAWALCNEGPLLRRATFEQLLRAEGFRFAGQVVDRLVLRSALAPGLPPEGLESMDQELMTADAITSTQWLKDLLSAGARSVADIHESAWLAHFEWSAIEGAKRRLGVRCVVAGIWELPAEESAPSTRRAVSALLEEEGRCP